MMVKVEFSIDNAAFTDPSEGEIRRVLTDAAMRLHSLTNTFPPDEWADMEPVLFDYNGNRIGTAEILED